MQQVPSDVSMQARAATSTLCCYATQRDPKGGRGISSTPNSRRLLLHCCLLTLAVSQWNSSSPSATCKRKTGFPFVACPRRPLPAAAVQTSLLLLAVEMLARVACSCSMHVTQSDANASEGLGFHHELRDSRAHVQHQHLASACSCSGSSTHQEHWQSMHLTRCMTVEACQQLIRLGFDV